MREAIVAAAVALLCFAPASAQVRDQRRAASTPADTDAASIARGWNELAAGRYTQAAAAADRVLARRPWDHAARILKIEALSALDPSRALDAYEQWLNAVPGSPEDAGLLEPVARGVLKAIASGDDRDLARQARAALAEARVQVADVPSGDPSPAAGQGPTTPAAAERAGDTAALVKLAGSGAPPARAEALQALGRLKDEQARPVLERALKDPDPFIRMSATVALARMKDPEALARVSQMLESPVPDIRLMAAEAWEGQDGPWVVAITPLLDDRDGLIRLRAARLLAPVDPDAAHRALASGLNDPNPVVRGETAKIVSEVAEIAPAGTSLPQLRPLLREPDPTVRLGTARAVLVIARNNGR